MKSVISLLTLILTFGLFAQDKSYLHTASVSNTSGHITYLDHPDLNDNPNANIFIIHNYSPGNILHDIPIGTWYDGSQWSVFNEDLSTMTIGAAFNIYIADGGTVIEHSQDGTSYTTELSHSSINGDPAATIISAKYWNPNGVYNLQNYGFWYDDTAQRWNLYAEDVNPQPINAYYKLLVSPGSGDADAYIHTVTVANVFANHTILDHPLLNGDPEAQVIAQHNWGTTGDAANIINDKVIGVWYNGTHWSIYNEDQSSMPVDMEFNVYVPAEILSVHDVNLAEVNVFPNPTSGTVHVNATEEINSITIFSTLGQVVQTIDGSSLNIELDLSPLPNGHYLLEIETTRGTQTKKLIKN